MEWYFGELEKNKIKLKFIPLEQKEFKELEIDISNIISEEELIEKINDLNLNNNYYYKIILIGRRNFEINKYKILKLIQKENIIKIKNNTKLNYDLNKIKEENNLKGIFIKKILEENNYSEEIIENAIQIGLETLE